MAQKTGADKVSEDSKLTLLAMGVQCEQDNQFEKAMQYYRTAMMLGSTEAQERFSSLMAKIQDVRRHKQALEEEQALERSARQGNAEDAMRLAKIYLSAQKVDKAVEMLQLASKYKNAEAAYTLAKMYETGDRVPKDFAKAEKCYELGAQNGHPECAYMWAKLLELRARDTTAPQEKERLLKEVSHWMKEAADRGYAKAAFEFALTLISAEQLEAALGYMEKAEESAGKDMPITVSLKDLTASYKKLAGIGMDMPPAPSVSPVHSVTR